MRIAGSQRPIEITSNNKPPVRYIEPNDHFRPHFNRMPFQSFHGLANHTLFRFHVYWNWPERPGRSGLAICTRMQVSTSGSIRDAIKWAPNHLSLKRRFIASRTPEHGLLCTRHKKTRNTPSRSMSVCANLKSSPGKGQEGDESRGRAHFCQLASRCYSLPHRPRI
jgi:hypothetical protein